MRLVVLLGLISLLFIFDESHSLCPAVKTPPLDTDKLSGRWYLVRQDSVSKFSNCTEFYIAFDFSHHGTLSANKHSSLLTFSLSCLPQPQDWS